MFSPPAWARITGRPNASTDSTVEAGGPATPTSDGSGAAVVGAAVGGGETDVDVEALDGAPVVAADTAETAETRAGRAGRGGRGGSATARTGAQDGGDAQEGPTTERGQR